MPDNRFLATFNRLESYIETRWGIPVVITDVPNPFTGDLDGAEIHVDFDLHAEEATFIVAHLFGHTVQWNTSPRAREIGTLIVKDASEELLRELADYERTAARYSLQLFHDAGVTDVDQWLSDFSACDVAYLMHFYRTGEKPPFRDFWMDGTDLLTPLAIPEFRPERWVARWGGVVI